MDEFPENFRMAFDPAPISVKNVAIFSTKFFRSKMDPPPQKKRKDIKNEQIVVSNAKNFARIF